MRATLPFRDTSQNLPVQFGKQLQTATGPVENKNCAHSPLAPHGFGVQLDVAKFLEGFRNNPKFFRYKLVFVYSVDFHNFVRSILVRIDRRNLLD